MHAAHDRREIQMLIFVSWSVYEGLGSPWQMFFVCGRSHMHAKHLHASFDPTGKAATTQPPVMQQQKNTSSLRPSLGGGSIVTPASNESPAKKTKTCCMAPWGVQVTGREWRASWQLWRCRRRTGWPAGSWGGSQAAAPGLGAVASLCTPPSAAQRSWSAGSGLLAPCAWSTSAHKCGWGGGRLVSMVEDARWLEVSLIGSLPKTYLCILSYHGST